MDDLHNRRSFLRAAAAAGVAWAAADFAQIDEALAWAAHQAAASDFDSLTVLTRPQALALDAMTSRILPSVDGRPGAHEAGVVFFIDRSLGSFAKDQAKLLAEGISDIDRRATRLAKRQASFAELSAPQQDSILHTVEKGPFFQAVRFATIAGAFALPKYGGNRDFAGWHLVGLDHQPRFDSPFGYYDAEANKKG